MTTTEAVRPRHAGLRPESGPMAARIARLPAGLRYLAAFILGAVFTLAFPPYHAVPVIILAFPALALLIEAAMRLRAAFWIGWLFGFGHMVTGLYWIGIAFFAQQKIPAWAAPIAVIALAAALAIFIGLAAVLARMLWRADWRRPFLLAACWGLFEWLRGHLLTGFPWNVASSVWTVSDVLIQPIAWIGTYGLSVVTVLVATAPVLLFDRARRSHLAALGIFASFLVLAAAGAFRLSLVEVGTQPGVTLRLVQANIPQTEKWRTDLRQRNFVRHLTLSESSPFPDGDLVVIWPETAVPYNLELQPSRRVLIGYMLPENAYLVTGAPRAEFRDESYRIWNSLFAIDSDGRIAARYDKTHLVPFGEYLPLRGLARQFGLEKLTAGAVDFSFGAGRSTIDISGLPAFSPLICYEVIFPGAVTAEGARPAWLLNLTNDGWYGISSGPYQHLALARMRSIEEGLPLVRSAGTGISAVVDPLGRVVRRIGLGQSGTIDSALPAPLPGPTLYARFGDMAAFLLIALFLILARSRNRHA